MGATVRGLLAFWAVLDCTKGTDPTPGGAKCPGELPLTGHGSIHMTNAYWNEPDDPAGEVEVHENHVVRVHMKGRTYFSNSCETGSFAHTRYTGLKLLNKRIRWRTNVNPAGCGCNAAVYLVSLPQNPLVSECEDYYCDANEICGVRCSEIDLQEANRHAFHSVLHLAADGSGKGLGYGGGGADWSNSRDWTSEQYGPGGSCIDTTKAFDVAVSFPTYLQGEELRLRAMVTTLSQDGCELEASVNTWDYIFNQEDSSKELTEALTEGMTPVVSYWSAPDMLWMDGAGADGLGPCESDAPELCGSTVDFWDFAVESLPEPVRLI